MMSGSGNPKCITPPLNITPDTAVCKSALKRRNCSSTAASLPEYCTAPLALVTLRLALYLAKLCQAAVLGVLRIDRSWFCAIDTRDLVHLHTEEILRLPESFSIREKTILDQQVPSET